MGPAEYQDIAIQIITDPPNVTELEPGIQEYKLTWAFSKYKPGRMLGTT
jgi:hypothetical protein